MTTNDPARRTATPTETLVNSFLNPPILIIRLRQQAELLLSQRDLPQIVGKMVPEDKKELIDKLNQVCCPDHRWFLALFPHAFPKGVPGCWRTGQTVLDLVRELLQCHPATSYFSFALRRTRKTR
jgi:hypothetical protein